MKKKIVSLLVTRHVEGDFGLLMDIFYLKDNHKDIKFKMEKCCGC